jgi:poly(hydroxyalkanoate) granule associated protein phasin
MATRKKTKKTTRTTTARRAVPRKSSSRGAAVVLRETWDAARKSLSAAEAEVEKQVRSLMKGNDAAETLRQIGTRLERERRKVARELETRVASLGARVQKERKSLARMVDDTVRGTLAALNIPSRHEINDLTRKVDELSRKIDGFSRPASRPAVRKSKRVPASA